MDHHYVQHSSDPNRAAEFPDRDCIGIIQSSRRFATQLQLSSQSRHKCGDHNHHSQLQQVILLLQETKNARVICY